MVLEMGGRWPYSCYFVGCCIQDLFIIPHSILVQFLSNFFSIHLVSVHVLHPYISMDTTADEKNCILFYQIDLTNSLLIADHGFTHHILISFSVDETLLPR